jgi:hypothetical protein
MFWPRPSIEGWSLFVHLILVWFFLTRSLGPCRRRAGDGEDEVEAVGAGGSPLHAQPPLSSGAATASRSLACIGRRGNGEEEETNPQPRREETNFVFGGPPPACPVLHSAC